MTTSTLIPPLVTSNDVVNWRAEQLRVAGYENLDAQQLAERADVDLHPATNLLDQGCPAPVALQIPL